MSWPPSTEEDLQAALDGGALEESHSLDLKKGPPGPGADGARAMATDMASFAVDGGWLIYGVSEDDHGRADELSPFQTAGFVERVDQVALGGRIDPPLAVTSSVIPADADAALGYVVVTVPASPAAPHMVDGKYRGRGDKTNRVLFDAEVLALHRAQADRAGVIDQLLDESIDLDPVEAQHFGHLFVVAHPTTARPGMLVDNVDAEHGWQSWMHHHILSGAPARRLDPGWSPDLGLCTTVTPRADGWSMRTHEISADRRADPDVHEAYLLDVEISETGTVRLFCGRGTDDVARNAGASELVILELVVLGLVKRAAMTALEIGTEMGYVGRWDLGMAMTAVRGARSFALHQDFRRSGTPFSDNAYRQVASASTAELRHDIDAVVKRLTDRLCRALNGGVHSRPPG